MGGWRPLHCIALHCIALHTRIALGIAPLPVRHAMLAYLCTHIVYLAVTRLVCELALAGVMRNVHI
jgi:hypothetical protein